MLPLWNFFLERRQFTILLLISLVLAGSAAVIGITKESAPEVQIPIGVVAVVLPGASAEDIERLVTNKLEEHLSNLQNLNKITSVSRDGISVVTAEFNASADLDKSIQKLKDEVDKTKVDLPTDAKDPSVTDVNFVDQPVQIVSITADAPFGKLAELGDKLKTELQTVKGVSKVVVQGVRHREVDIVVRKEEMARLGLSIGQIVAAVGSANASLPIGAITINDIAYNIAFKGSLDEVKDIGGVAILNDKGQVIYLRDIADVTDGIEKATSYSRISVAGEPAQQSLTLAVFKVRGQDVTAATRAVRAKLEDLKKTILEGSTVLITNDAGTKVQKDLTELSRTGFETILLVMLALFATIGWREALVAGLSIPFSFLMAFIGLYYSGNTINFVSLFALILAIGILVDSGIVVIEAIHTRRSLYHNKIKAAQEALKEYAWPLIGGTMTTVAVFFPLFFISGVVGKFIASIPYTLIFVLIASIFVALGLVPTLAILFTTEEHSTLANTQEEYAEKARVWYAGFLHRFLANKRSQNRFMVGMCAALVFVFFLPSLGLLKVTFFPQDNSEFIYVDIETPQGTSLNRTDLAARAVEEKLYGDPRISSLITTVGASSAFGAVGSEQRDTRYANITINLVDKNLRKQNSTQVLEDVKKKLAGISLAYVRVGQPTGGPPVGAPVTINYLGTDRDTLDTAVAHARAILEKTPGATDVDATNKNDGTEFTLKIDRAKLAQVGLSASQVASALRAAVSGVTATKLTGGNTDVDIVVTLNLNPGAIDPHDASRANIDAIRGIPMVTQSGSTVLLGSVLEETIARSDAVIYHQGRQRIVSLTANTAPGYTVKDVLSSFNKAMASSPLPTGVRQSIGGEDEQTNKSFAEMGLAFLAGLGLMFSILVLAFDSFRHPFYLIGMVIFSLIGVFGGLTLTGQPLSFSSILGVIALAGVIINHAIILTDSIMRRLHAGGEGRKLADIIVDAAVSRLRPIVLTTITTVVGMIPLTYASALWGPLAFAILFGLSFAMILTLVFIPTLVYRWPGKLPEGVTK